MIVFVFAVFMLMFTYGISEAQYYNIKCTGNVTLLHSGKIHKIVHSAKLYLYDYYEDEEGFYYDIESLSDDDAYITIEGYNKNAMILDYGFVVLPDIAPKHGDSSEEWYACFAGIGKVKDKNNNLSSATFKTVIRYYDDYDEGYGFGKCTIKLNKKKS